MGVSIDLIDKDCTLSELEEENIYVHNISASFSITGEFDLTELTHDLPNSEYEPEKQRSLIYRPSGPQSTVILLPRGGRVSLAGATNKEEIRNSIAQFMDSLRSLGIEREYSDIQVENLVATTDLNQTLNLNAIAIQLGLEQVEYEPEQFPGAIYRAEDAVILIFDSGKIVITSVSTYQHALECVNKVKRDIGELSVS